MKIKLILTLFVALLTESIFATPGTTCFARFVPERDDDFAWENDKVAFRGYGPFYRGKSVNSGFDCWLKRVDHPIIDKWYAAHLNGVSYHEDHGEGYDPYHVGPSRGCGGLALWLDGKMVPSPTFSEWNVIKSDDAEVIFTLKYQWEHAGDQYEEEKRISLRKGDQLFRAQSTFYKNGMLAVGLPIAVGLTTHDGKAVAKIDAGQGWMTCWEVIDGSGLGTGVAMDPARITDHKTIVSKKKDESHILLITETDENGQVEYQAGYGWERAGEINTAKAWNDYLAKQHVAVNIFERDTILSAMRKVNDYAVENPWRPYDRDWIRATMYTGVMEAYHATGDETYLQQATAWAEKHHYGLGHEHSGFNRMFCTMTWLELYQIDPDPKKIANIEKGLLEDKPFKPEVGKIWYGHEPHANDAGWVYADSLYAAPAFVMLAKATGNPHYMDLLNDAFWNATDIIFDEEENLYYRDPTYIGKKSTYGGKILWARGNGWVFAGLPRVIKNLSKDDPYYDRYVEVYKKMAAALAMRQGDDGFWRANLGDDWHYRMPESSSTAFFTAGFAWGVNAGLLDKETYLPVLIRGWDALNRSLHPDGFMGWIQPVDAAPRPSHPKSTQEYGVGLFLYAGAQVVQLVDAGIITPAVVNAAMPPKSQLLPPAAFADKFVAKEHPIAKQMNAFLKAQPHTNFDATRFKRDDYLDVIAGQIKVMHSYQNEEGRIIDPVEKSEKYFATPCYAHSVAALAKAGYPIGDEIIESGMKALDVSLADLAANTAKDHSDFYTWPMVLALELFDGVASKNRKAEWLRKLGQMDHTKYHFYRKPIEPSDHRGFYKTYNGHFAGNWNLVHSAGEWIRTRHGFGDPWYVDYCLTMQLKSFTQYGMYNEGGNPLAYDLFSRHYLNGMLALGYDSFLHSTYRDILWRGAWTSLFMQSPFGEQPTGYRSTHHIWNEAEQAVVFETYASAYSKAGKTAEAGAFKRAANLSLASIKNWIRPDGSGFVVKNRYPVEAKHGYESYTVHSCYNLLACSMLAQAWQFADDSIAEAPAPADVGGYVVPVLWYFRKAFANVEGNYVQYDINGDHKYNPTGLLRIHLKNGHPQLGPSDGASALFSGDGVNLAVGPSWRKGDGTWVKLADYNGPNPWIQTLEESTDVVRFKVVYPDVTQTITVDKEGVTVEDVVTAQDADSIRVSFPMLVFDGKDRTEVELNENKLSLMLNGRGINFRILEPAGLQLQRSGKELKHRNGMVEEVSAEGSGARMIYRISAKRQVTGNRH